MKPVGTRIVVVAKDGSGDCTAIAAAVNAAQPGDTIQVKDGTYVGRVNPKRDGTATAPIALINFPNHSPVIKISAATHPAPNDQLRMEGDWWLVEGFEIVDGNTGIKIYGDHITLRRNNVHHHSHQNVLALAPKHQ